VIIVSLSYAMGVLGSFKSIKVLRNVSVKCSRVITWIGC